MQQKVQNNQLLKLCFLLFLLFERNKRNRRRQEKHKIPVDPAILVTPVSKFCLYVAYVLMSKKETRETVENKVFL